MTVEMLLFALSNIKDEYIAETKKKTINRKKIMIFSGMAAACLVLFFLIPNIPNFFGMGAQEGDIYRNGYLIEDINISQIAEAYDGKLLAQNIIGDSNFEFYSKTDTFSDDTGNWHSLLYSEYNTDSKIIMHCMFGEQAENWKVDMVFTNEATKTAVINGIPVEIAKFDLNLSYSFTHYALFEYDGVVYDLRVSSNDENTILEILEILIK